MKNVSAYKAQACGSTTPEAVTIRIKDELPTTATDDTLDLEARRIAGALWEALPGGTLDRLCAELLRRQASRLHVARRPPATVGGEQT